MTVHSNNHKNAVKKSICKKDKYIPIKKKFIKIYNKTLYMLVLYLYI